jgi:hypothetical protein
MSQLGRAEPLHLRLFIEGIEVPVISAVVSGNEGAPASAQIEIVPANAGLHLAARSKVILFFYDGGDETAPSDADIEASNAGARTPTEERRLEDEGYYQLFSGELFSLTYSKSGAGSRGLVLQCLDDSNNWDTTYLYTLRYSADSEEGVVAGSQAAMMGISGGAAAPDDILNDPPHIISTISKRQQALNPSVAGSKGMLGGLLGILELIGGVPGQYMGMTAWHTIQETRVRLLDQIAADDGDTAVQVFDETAFEHWLLAGVADLGTVVSFRTIVDLINQFIYYTVSPNPVGVYIPGDGGVPKWPDGLFDAAIENESTDDKTGVDAGMDPEFAELKNAILAYLINDLGWDGASAKSGGKPRARMTSGYRSSAEQAAVMVGTAREGQTPSSPHMAGFAADFSTTDGIGFCYKNKPSDSPKASLHKRLIWAATKYGLSDADKIYEKAVDKGLLTKVEVARAKQMVNFYRDLEKAVKERGQGKVFWGGGWSATDAWLKLYGLGGDCVHTERIGWRDKVKGEGSDGSKTTSPVDLSGYYTSSLMNRERLFTQFFHPDIWFASPPACNVIFPEEITTLTFNRDFMRETTRLQLSTVNAVIGDSTLLNPVYFAPTIDKALNLTSGGLGTAARAFIMPHEKFSGIVPKMEKISDLSLYVRISEEQEAAEPAAAAPATAEDQYATSDPNAPEPTPSTTPEVPPAEGEEKSTLEKWAARTTAFTFLSYRYDARSLSLSLKFTPRLAIGFPALVVDRTNPETTEDEQNEPSTSSFSSNHFLGTIRSLTHSVTQEGGATTASLSHARLHKAAMDDLHAASVYENKGMLSVQVVPNPAEPQTYTNTDTSMGTRVFRWLQSVRDKLVAGKLDLAKPDIPGPHGMALTGAITVVKVLPEGGTVTWSTNIRDLVGPQLQDEFPFSSITYTEQTGTAAYLPLEEAIKPAWVSETYSNKLIGGFYKQILGCGSIHDLYPNVSPGEAPDGVPYSGASIERVTEALVAEYSASSDGGYLGHEFIRGKTGRSYASIGQVFGYETGTGESRKKVEGFYTQSIGDFSGLKGDRWTWMTESNGTLVNEHEDNKIDPGLDPRSGRRAPALAYQYELTRALGRRG